MNKSSNFIDDVRDEIFKYLTFLVITKENKCA